MRQPIAAHVLVEDGLVHRHHVRTRGRRVVHASVRKSAVDWSARRGRSGRCSLPPPSKPSGRPAAGRKRASTESNGPHAVRLPAEPKRRPSSEETAVSNAEPGSAQSTPTTNETLVVPEPPMFRSGSSSRPRPGRRYSPGHPQVGVQDLAAAVAPTGWPAPIRPPDGLIGCLPSISSQPFSTAFRTRQGRYPEVSIAMYSRS